MARERLTPTGSDLEDVFRMKYCSKKPMGWGPKLRRRFGYFSPDDIYESLLAKLVNPTSKWLDVGCGRNLFLDNKRLSQILAKRAELLVGVDPDSTIDENPYVHRRIKGTIEQIIGEQTYTLVSLKMVAEHLESPREALRTISALTVPRGRVVVYTVNRWTPVALVSALVPFRFHHGIKNLIWRSECKDTFPVAYRMNSRSVLSQLFGEIGFHEIYFKYLDDCRTSTRSRLLHLLELSIWRLLKTVGLSYPETCLLGVYEKE